MTDPKSGRWIVLWPAVATIVALAGCTHRIKVDPIQVEPIHLTLDINLKVDRELDEFFDFEEDAAPAGETPATSATGEPS